MHPSQVALSLFWRTFFLLAVLLAGGVFAWVQTFRALEFEPRAVQAAQQIASLVNLARSALQASDGINRLSLIKSISKQESVKLAPREPQDKWEPYEVDRFTRAIGAHMRGQLGPDTLVASSRAIRLKPMLTARISLVSVFSSRRDSNSPSRMRLAANDSSLSGWLMSRAIAAEPKIVASSAMPSHSVSVLQASGSTRVVSACSQYGSRSIEKPTHSPPTPLTEFATSVSGPSCERMCAPIAREKRSTS